MFIPFAYWKSANVNFSATMTVGKNGSNTIYGYDPVTPYGSMSNINMTIGGLPSTIWALVYNVTSSTLVLYIDNGSTTSAPTQWDTLTIGGVLYNRTDFNQDTRDSTIWRFTFTTTPNPIGTTVGATRIIQIN